MMDNGYWIAIGVYLFIGACVAATVTLLLLSNDDDAQGCAGCLTYLMLDAFLILFWPVAIVAGTLAKLIQKRSKSESDDEGQSE